MNFSSSNQESKEDDDENRPFCFMVSKTPDRRDPTKFRYSGNPLFLTDPTVTTQCEDAADKKGFTSWFSPVDFRSNKWNMNKDYCETKRLPPVPLCEVEESIQTLVSGKVNSETGDVLPWEDTSFYGQGEVMQLFLSFRNGNKGVNTAGKYTIFPTKEIANQVIANCGGVISWSGVMTVLLKESMVYPLKEDRCFMTADQQARLAHGHHQPLVLPQGPLLDGTGNEIPDEEVGKAIVKWKTRKEKPVLMNEDGTPDYCAEAQFARNASMELHGQNFIIFAAREGLKRDEKTKEFTETFGSVICVISQKSTVSDTIQKGRILQAEHLPYQVLLSCEPYPPLTNSLKGSLLVPLY